MKNKQRGFTLIELLVVVLIIGILAAVALPQYQLSVAKSRASTYLAGLSSVKQTIDLFYLENGYLPDDPAFLAVDLPVDCQLGSEGLSVMCNNSAANNVPKMEYYSSFVTRASGASFRGHLICWGGQEEGSIKDKVCKSLSGKSTYDVYASAGVMNGRGYFLN